MKNQILVFVAAMLLAIGCRKQASDQLAPEVATTASKIIPTSANQPKLPSEEPHTLLVGLRNNAAKAKTFAKNHVMKTYHTVTMQRTGDPGFHKIFSKDKKADMVRLKADPNVAWVSPNYAVYTQDTPNDPYYNSTDLWGLFNTNAASAWNAGNHGSQQIIVGVVDEPPFICHEDLKDQFWINPYETPNDGIDNDGNGYIDDMQGWNFVINSKNIYMGSGLTHGSHVSGTVGARGFNNKGVVGISPNITMIAAPFLGSGGGYIDNAIMAFDYLTGLKILHPDLKISHSTNSWGGGGFSQGFIDAINRAKAQDIGCVFAAGNSQNNNDVAPMYPAGYKPLIGDYLCAVASTAGNNALSWFSGYGQTTVDLGAPGEYILSTISTTEGSAYGHKSGTSMATPHVAGSLALLRAAHSDWTFDKCLQELRNATTKVSALTTVTISGGVLNLNSPIFTASTPAIQPTRECVPTPINTTPPGAPKNFRTFGYGIDVDGKIYIGFDWDVPPEGDIVNHVAHDHNGNELWLAGHPIVVAGIHYEPYKEYYLQFGNMWGYWSDTSNHFSIYFDNPPPADEVAPTLNGGITLSNITTTSITASWPAASDNVGVTGYTLNWRAVGGIWQAVPVSGTLTSLTLNNLSVNTTYEFYYTARDHAGNVSNNSETVSATTLTPPPPPPAEDNIAPVVTILSPQDGYQIPVKGNKNVKITFTATDNVGVTLRQILIDGVIVATNVSNYTWNTNKAAKGQHVITCKAFDAATNEGRQSVTVFKN